MSTFRYWAMSGDGRGVQGMIEAPDERTAAALIKERALFITRLAPADQQDSSAAGGQDKLRAQALVFLLREMALMTRCGVTLLRALEICAAERGRKAQARMAQAIAERVRSGQSLSQAIAAEPSMPRLAVRIVESGEATGDLPAALERIAGIVERRATLQRNLLTSLAYPAIVFLVAVAVATFMIVGVVPKFVGFFMTRGKALPWTTQALLDTSIWVRENGLLLLSVLLLVTVTLALVHASQYGRLALHRFALSIPVVGKLWQVGSLAQITWTLGELLRSGVSLLDSIRITASSVGNRALSEHLAGTAERVLGGEPLSRGLEHRLVPVMVPGLLAAGEQSGAMAEVLSELARFFQQDLDLRIRRMSSLVEPALILVVGGMVGFVYLAFFQALLGMAS